MDAAKAVVNEQQVIVNKQQEVGINNELLYFYSPGNMPLETINFCVSLSMDNQVTFEPRSMHHLFYDEYEQRPVPNYDKNIVRGWFVGGFSALNI